MKLTPEIKRQIDSMTFGQLWARFRFFPWGEYRGEAGEYLKERILEARNEDNHTSKRR